MPTRLQKRAERHCGGRCASRSCRWSIAGVPPSAGTIRWGTIPLSHTTSGCSLSDERTRPRPCEHRSGPAAPAERSDRELVHGQAQVARPASNATVGRHGQLELDVLIRQCGGQPQQRELGAAELGRLGHGEYA